MTDQKEENNIYDIFDYIKIYQDYENNENTENTEDNENTEDDENIEIGSNDSIKSCDTVEWKHNEKLNNLCKKFIILYKKLYPPEVDKNGSTTNKHAEYLNFWFNNKLKNIHINLDDESIYSSLKNICNTIDTSNRIKDKIYKIPEEDYNKFDILNNLYTNYIKLETTEDVQLNQKSHYIDNSKICIEKFTEAINLYHQKNNVNFYKALQKFSVLYQIAKYRLAFFKNIEVDPLPILEKEIAKKKLEDACNSFVTNTLDSTLGINNTQEILLKDFPEYQKYNEFYKETNEQSICVKYCDKIIHLKNKDITTVCIKLASNLEKLSSMTSISVKHRERCSYMNYWTYNIIMHTLNNISDNKDKWKEEKDLHDYFKNYSNIDELPSDDSKKIDYCKYITYINSLYEKYVHSCCTYFYNNPYWNDCIAYFNCDEVYNPYNLYLKLNCQELSTDQIKIFKRVTTPVPIDYKVILLSKMSPFMQNRNLISDPFYTFTLGAFSLLGIFLLFFILYKFSPIGRRFNVKKLNKEQKITHNFNESNHQKFLQKDVNYVNKSSKKEKIRIAYQNT